MGQLISQEIGMRPLLPRSFHLAIITIFIIKQLL